MAKRSAREIATTRFNFLFVKKFTKGFKRIAIIMANARGIKILLSSKSTNTNRIIPNKVTVDLKKKGYFFCIN